MSDSPDPPGESERTKQVSSACMTAGFSAFFALGCLSMNQSWPTALGVTAVMAMVSVVCFFILRR